MKIKTETLKALAKGVQLNSLGHIVVHIWREKGSTQDYGAFIEGIKDRAGAVPITVAYLDARGIEEVLGNQDKGQAYQDLLAYAYGDPSWSYDNIGTTIDILELSPPDLLHDVDPAHKPLLIDFIRQLFFAASQPQNTFIQLRVPSQKAADEAGLDFCGYLNTWEQLIHVNYENLKGACCEKIRWLSGFDRFELITGQDFGRSCKLTFEIGQRQWHTDAGNGDFPAGEVYIAPLESSARGEFLADRVFWEGTWYEQVLLTFEAGVLVASQPPCIFEDLSHAPGDSLRLGEFGLGTNIGSGKELSGHCLFDEKIMGTCHIALGCNDMFGGTNRGPVHIDFVASQYKIGNIL